MKKTPIIILCVLAAAVVFGAVFLGTQFISFYNDRAADSLILSGDHYSTALSLERDEIIELNDEVFKKDPEMKILITIMEGKHRVKSMPISDNLFEWLSNYGLSVSNKRGQELLDTYGMKVYPNGTKRYLLYEGEYYQLVTLHYGSFPPFVVEPLPA